MPAISSNAATRIVDEILSSTDEILAVAIIQETGQNNMLATKAVDSFKKEFGLPGQADKYGATLAIAALAVANELKDFAGEAQALITIYKKCKMMLVPIASHEILVGLVLKRISSSSKVEEDPTFIMDIIERSLSLSSDVHSDNNAAARIN